MKALTLPSHFHEPGCLLSPSLSTIPNGGEGSRRPGEEALRIRASKARSIVSGYSLPEAIYRLKLALLATLTGLLLLTSLNSRAGYHAWDINEIYSNPDGTVQFIELRALGGGQQFMNNAVTIRATNSTVTNIFVCNSNLPADTFGRFCIIGTSNLTTTPGGVRPDFFIPPNFIPRPTAPGNGAVLFLPNGFPGNNVAAVYGTLPTNGDGAVVRSGASFVVAPTNSPRNFNQQSNVVVPVKFLAASRTDTNFVFSFRTATGVNGSAGPNYSVEATGDFAPASWAVATNRPGNGTTQSVAIPIVAGTNQFFRLRVP